MWTLSELTGKITQGVATAVQYALDEEEDGPTAIDDIATPEQKLKAYQKMLEDQNMNIVELNREYRRDMSSRDAVIAKLKLQVKELGGDEAALAEVKTDDAATTELSPQDRHRLEAEKEELERQLQEYKDKCKGYIRQSSSITMELYVKDDTIKKFKTTVQELERKLQAASVSESNAATQEGAMDDLAEQYSQLSAESEAKFAEDQRLIDRLRSDKSKLVDELERTKGKSALQSKAIDELTQLSQGSVPDAQLHLITELRETLQAKDDQLSMLAGELQRVKLELDATVAPPPLPVVKTEVKVDTRLQAEHTALTQRYERCQQDLNDAFYHVQQLTEEVEAKDKQVDALQQRVAASAGEGTDIAALDEAALEAAVSAKSIQMQLAHDRAIATLQAEHKHKLEEAVAAAKAATQAKLDAEREEAVAAVREQEQAKRQQALASAGDDSAATVSAAVEAAVNRERMAAQLATAQAVEEATRKVQAECEASARADLKAAVETAVAAAKEEAAAERTQAIDELRRSFMESASSTGAANAEATAQAVAAAEERMATRSAAELASLQTKHKEEVKELARTSEERLQEAEVKHKAALAAAAAGHAQALQEAAASAGKTSQAASEALAAEWSTKLAEATAQHEAAVAALTSDHERNMEEAKEALRAEHQAATDAALANANAEYEAKLSTAQAEHDAAMEAATAQAKSVLETSLATSKTQHEAELSAARLEADAALEAAVAEAVAKERGEQLTAAESRCNSQAEAAEQRLQSELEKLQQSCDEARRNELEDASAKAVKEQEAAVEAAAEVAKQQAADEAEVALAAALEQARDEASAAQEAALADAAKAAASDKEQALAAQEAQLSSQAAQAKEQALAAAAEAAAAAQRAAVDEAIAATQAAADAALASKVAELDESHAAAMAKAASQATAAQQAAVSEAQAKLQSEHDARVEELTQQHTKAVSDMTEAHAAALQERADQIAVLEKKMESIVADTEERLAAEHAAALKAASDEADRRVAEKEVEVQGFKDKYREEATRRKQIHNELLDLKGNIRVFARVRPVVEAETKSGRDVEVTSYPAPGDLVVKQDDDGLITKRFEFDRVFTPGSTQEGVFEDVQPFITSVLNGYNVCIFAYGQTGSGKTFTMEGPPTNRGVNHRALQKLFDDAAGREDEEFILRISMLEIYNENVFDLNGPSANKGTNRPKLDIRKRKNGHVFVQDLTWTEVTSMDAVLEVLQAGSKNRAAGSHDMNAHSSRSHLVVGVVVESTNKISGVRTKAKLNLIDLAGSERISKTSASGTRLKEAQAINKSLSALGDVVGALAHKDKKHVPFRNSKLTFLLQDSLGGNSKVLMFVNVSPVMYNCSETMCSLNFAQRCRSVELGAASKNSDSAEVAKLKKQIAQLQGSSSGKGFGAGTASRR